MYRVTLSTTAVTGYPGCGLLSDKGAVLRDVIKGTLYIQVSNFSQHKNQHWELFHMALIPLCLHAWADLTLQFAC